eukprot:gene14915-17636_t
MAICEFILYRTSKAGIYQPYYKINLSKARISSIDFVTPHAVLEKELEPQERIAFIYEDISWEHTLAGTNAMSKWQDRNAQWADYVGDILRGAQPINQLVPQHPYLNDVPLIDELRHQNTHHVIPLTLDVAKKILSPITSFDYIHFITTHPSGIKDTLAWLVNAGKLMTEFDDNGKIIFNLNALNPWLLEKLGKYIFSSRAPQVLELAIGWRGALSESIKGVKFCIWFSVAWRTIEFIMSSERDLVNFLGDFSMDVAKAVIAGGVATAIGSLASFACVSFGFPVILVGGAILLTGI